MRPNVEASGPEAALSPEGWASSRTQENTVNRKRTAEECFAKAEAYKSCADHLELEWTDDPLERQAGEALQKTLRDREKHWRKIGQQRMTTNVLADRREPQSGEASASTVVLEGKEDA